MIFTGKNITRSHIEPLKKSSFREIFQTIKSTENELYNQINKLRRVKNIDEKVYQSLKKELPFFIGANFTNNLRKSANFISISYIVLDIDHCFQNEAQFINLRNDLSQDQQVFTLFTSPGGDGLKIVFELESPCTDTKIFSDFYRIFAVKFAREHALEKYLDTVTCDVTRVCFLSHDKMFHYNPAPLKIKWKTYIPHSELTIPQMEAIEYVEYSNETNKREKENNKDIDHETYAEILRKLKTGRPARKPKNYIVPVILEKIIDPASKKFNEYGFKVREIRDINYGKKFIVTHEANEAEINIFYGKKGFSVVKSPRKGTHPDLNEIVCQIAQDVIDNQIFDPGTFGNVADNEKWRFITPQ